MNEAAIKWLEDRPDSAFTRAGRMYADTWARQMIEVIREIHEDSDAFCCCFGAFQQPGTMFHSMPEMDEDEQVAWLRRGRCDLTAPLRRRLNEWWADGGHQNMLIREGKK